MGLYPKNLKEYVNLAGVPRGYGSKIFIVDTENGDDDNDPQRRLCLIKSLGRRVELGNCAT